MFRSLKEKLKKLTSSLEEAVEEAVEKEPPRVPKVGLRDKAKSLLEGKVVISEGAVDDVLMELQLLLLESDVAFDVAEKICASVKERLVGTKRGIGESVHGLVEDALRQAMEEVLTIEHFDFDAFVKEHEKPVHILFVGVNGTGKTTTIAKVAKYLMDRGYSVVLAAGDTFRAGAIQQLQTHADRLGVKLIKHQEGADPAAVLYDALAYARAKHRDVVLSDTAGRMHTNVNLMEQLAKICRVAPPDLTLFVDEATAGNDAVERAKKFAATTGFDGSILTKIDADTKGGAAISIAHETEKPIIFLGTGQGYDDLVPFDAEWLLDRIFE
ncbi:MAG TPA: signal recognition particle-docking protein FtsY [Methermicoccus shengliensis]|uniref:Signal recognition particle receptor FtsY n=2 Tax=Methermicoccus shengliensis TaxID=660064 RepID=A0A832VMG4_9EURY|nr:signal recognition particle-docking protein FtsY [Methermicoccus shengliensis]HIH69256.1 signal recognition particle-docking protein FtsY [Methermicoccus shengliensis]